MVTLETLNSSLEEYKKQFDTLNAQMGQAEQNWQRQRELGFNTLNQLQGAIAAVQVLIDNVPCTCDGVTTGCSGLTCPAGKPGAPVNDVITTAEEVTARYGEIVPCDCEVDGSCVSCDQ